MCLARALVTDMATQECHPELHQKADIPEGLCGLTEVAKFQEVITVYQIVVLSAEHFNATVYEGSRKEKQIYLYHHDNHFDIITSVSAFLGKNYWCLECKKGYDSKERHRCSKVCKCCFVEGCQGVVKKAPWRECGQCHRMFAGDECYANHCRPNKGGQSVCSKFYKCKRCNKVMARNRRRPEDHECGEVLCRNCDEYVQVNTHRCYMKPIRDEFDEGQQEGADRRKKTKKKKRVSKEAGDDEEQEYLFFDIETRHDKGRHVAKLLIVQDETGDETVFKGDECVKEFTSWLLDGTHQGAIVIAHNFRSFDGILLCEQFYKQLLLPKLILNGAKIMAMDLDEAEIKFRDSLNFLPMALK